MNVELFFFWLFAFLGIASALMVILTRNALSCAFLLICFLINSAGLFVLLTAHFVAVAQVLVYAGAIMVLFIFVIMLLNLPAEKFHLLDWEKSQIPGIAMVALSLVAFFVVLARSVKQWQAFPPLLGDFGTISAVGHLMFTKYVVSFEIVGVLLLVATVGAILLAKRVV